MCLRFGIGGRCLPRQVEAVAFSFLDLEDWTQLFIVSQSLFSTMSDFFRALKCLRCDVRSLYRQNDTKQTTGLHLASKFCRSLTTIDCVKRSVYDDDDDDDYINSGMINEYIQRLIRQNQNSLRLLISDTKLTNRTIDALTRYPNLEALDVANVLKSSRKRYSFPQCSLSKDVLCRICTDILPKLRSLTLCDSPSYPLCTRRSVEKMARTMLAQRQYS